MTEQGVLAWHRHPRPGAPARRHVGPGSSAGDDAILSATSARSRDNQNPLPRDRFGAPTRHGYLKEPIPATAQPSRTARGGNGSGLFGSARWRPGANKAPSLSGHDPSRPCWKLATVTHPV